MVLTRRHGFFRAAQPLLAAGCAVILHPGLLLGARAETIFYGDPAAVQPANVNQPVLTTPTLEVPGVGTFSQSTNFWVVTTDADNLVPLVVNGCSSAQTRRLELSAATANTGSIVESDCLTNANPRTLQTVRFTDTSASQALSRSDTLLNAIATVNNQILLKRGITLNPGTYELGIVLTSDQEFVFLPLEVHSNLGILGNATLSGNGNGSYRIRFTVSSAIGPINRLSLKMQPNQQFQEDLQATTAIVVSDGANSYTVSAAGSVAEIPLPVGIRSLSLASPAVVATFRPVPKPPALSLLPSTYTGNNIGLGISFQGIDLASIQVRVNNRSLSLTIPLNSYNTLGSSGYFNLGLNSNSLSSLTPNVVEVSVLPLDGSGRIIKNVTFRP